MAPSALEHDKEQPLKLQSRIVSQKTAKTNGSSTDGTSMALGVHMNGADTRKQNGAFYNVPKIPHLSISEDYKVSDQPIGTIAPIRMICIGAGASGVNLAYQVQKNMQNTELVLYEKSPAIGGTWYENRYPGCKCDIREYVAEVERDEIDQLNSISQLSILVGAEPELGRDVFALG
jgi:hypothetical protein